MSRYPGCPLFGPREEKDRSAACGGQHPPDDFRGVPAQGSAGSPPSWESAAAGRSNGWVALAGRRIRRLTRTRITPVTTSFYRKEPPVFDTFGQIAGHGGQAQSWAKHNDFWRCSEVGPGNRVLESEGLGSVSRPCQRTRRISRAGPEAPGSGVFAAGLGPTRVWRLVLQRRV